MTHQDRDGRLAYDTYAETTGGRTYDGRPMPTWEELPQSVRHAWGCAARAVRSRAIRESRDERDL